jgi:cobalt-precorrin-5B (C1)-methyltransferase
MQTHVAANQVDFAFLADVCRGVGAPAALVDAVRAANTGRHFLELCQVSQQIAPLQRVVELALTQCQQFIAAQGGAMGFEAVLVDFNGAILARASAPAPVQLATSAHDVRPLIERLAADFANAYADDEPLEET